MTLSDCVRIRLCKVTRGLVNPQQKMSRIFRAMSSYGINLTGQTDSSQPFLIYVGRVPPAIVTFVEWTG